MVACLTFPFVNWCWWMVSWSWKENNRKPYVSSLRGSTQTLEYSGNFWSSFLGSFGRTKEQSPFPGSPLGSSNRSSRRNGLRDERLSRFAIESYAIMPLFQFRVPLSFSRQGRRIGFRVNNWGSGWEDRYRIKLIGRQRKVQFHICLWPKIQSRLLFHIEGKAHLLR